MNYSLITADRATHLKIVVLSLLAAIAVVAVGVSSRATASGSAGRSEPTMIAKSGKTLAHASVQTIIR